MPRFRHWARARCCQQRRFDERSNGSDRVCERLPTGDTYLANEPRPLGLLHRVLGECRRERDRRRRGQRGFAALGEDVTAMWTISRRAKSTITKQYRIWNRRVTMVKKSHAQV
jgi:hypothetical protein